jgi:hypothetical protein
MSCPSQSSWLDHPNDICWGVQSIKLFVLITKWRFTRITRNICVYIYIIYNIYIYMGLVLYISWN